MQNKNLLDQKKPQDRELDELQVMRRINSLLRRLPKRARGRVLAWVAGRNGFDVTSAPEEPEVLEPGAPT